MARTIFVHGSGKAGGPKFGGQSANEFWIDGKNYASVTAAGLDGGSTNPAYRCIC